DKPDFVARKVRIFRMPIIPKGLQTATKIDNVLAALIVDKKGKVIDLAIVETTNERQIPAVKKAMTEWVFVPATLKGKEVACLLYAPLSLKIVPFEEILAPTPKKPNAADGLPPVQQK